MSDPVQMRATASGVEAVVYHCAFCNGEVNPLATSTYHRVVGWERKAQGASRRSGSDIALREPREVFAHGTCVDRAKAGIGAGQGALL